MHLRASFLISTFCLIVSLMAVDAYAGAGRGIGRLLGSWMNGNTTGDMFTNGFLRRDDVVILNRGPREITEQLGGSSTAQVFRYTPRGANAGNPDVVRVHTRIRSGSELRYLDISTGLTRRDFDNGVEVVLPPRTSAREPYANIAVLQRQGDKVTHRKSYTTTEINGAEYRQTIESARFFGGGDTVGESFTAHVAGSGPPFLRYTTTSPDGEVYQTLGFPIRVPEGHSLVHAEIMGSNAGQLTLFMVDANGNLVRRSAPITSPRNPRGTGDDAVTDFEIGELGPNRPISAAEREVLTSAEMRVYSTEPSVLTANGGSDVDSVGGGIGGLNVRLTDPDTDGARGSVGTDGRAGESGASAESR
ncbi:MAG: hypothetical protein HRT45_10745 [Bdellovibrionales bacterium]|nr:hypothetical protein [Bdellovibrionales bacterium]